MQHNTNSMKSLTTNLDLSFNSKTFCFPSYFHSIHWTLFIQKQDKVGKDIGGQHIPLMGKTSKRAFRNWGDVTSHAVVPIADCFQRPENIQSKGEFFFWILLSSMFMALCTKCT